MVCIINMATTSSMLDIHEQVQSELSWDELLVNDFFLSIVDKVVHEAVHPHSPEPPS